MKSLLHLFLLSICTVSTAQDLVDVSGQWNGNSNFLKANFSVTTIIDQKGSQLEGYSISKSMDGSDSSKVMFNGVVDGTTIKLFPVRFEYKTGAACLANSVLQFTEEGDQHALTGKWKGDLRLTTCPPAIGGNLKLYKDKSPKVKIVADNQVTKSINQTDDVGNALLSELGKRKYYALIIGVDNYPDERIQNLDNPVGDAVRLSNVLIEEYSFNANDVTILKNPSREQVINSLDQLSQSVTEKDNLLIFYAGHGIWNEQLNQGYWLPSDASLSSKSYWLSNSTIRDYVGGIRSKHTLLISDACFSGGILKERAVFEDSRAILELYKLPSRKAMTSGTLKTVPDKSVFIEYLIKNLKTNAAPLISADQLFRNFKIAVINNSPNGQVPQYGPITQAGDEGGDFV
ncbi:MAG: caspase family protein, partial [Cyclobacteriaceae bacterium]